MSVKFEPAIWMVEKLREAFPNLTKGKEIKQNGVQGGQRRDTKKNTESMRLSAIGHLHVLRPTTAKLLYPYTNALLNPISMLQPAGQQLSR